MQILANGLIQGLVVALLAVAFNAAFLPTKVFNHALARWPALKVLAGDGRVPIDNNSAERAMRNVEVGRKNVNVP